MKPAAALDGLVGRMFGLVRVLNADGIVGTTERSLVSEFILESPFGNARGALVLFVELGRACDWADGVYWLGEGKGCDAWDVCGKESGGACEDARSKHCVTERVIDKGSGV